MFRNSKTKKILLIVGFLFLAGSGYKLYAAYDKDVPLEFQNSQKVIHVDDNGHIFPSAHAANTVEEAMEEAGIALGEHDQIIPDRNSRIYPGMKVRIDRAVRFTLSVDDTEIEGYSAEKTIDGIIRENNIALGNLDKVSPDLLSRPYEDSEIIITRINIEQKIIKEDIDFKTVTRTDDSLGWREEKIEQKGEKGIREVKYEITYKNGKEVSRIPLEKNILKDPVQEIVTKGTYMKLGKAQRGHASFYASSWGELNASRSIPRGGYAKVTNMDTGKSVIVKINDYGPQSPERIIDLSYTSFAKIGSLGQGILPNVKVEQILN